MEEFAQLFGSLPTFAYHCFDRIVILGHLPLLIRPENTCSFFAPSTVPKPSPKLLRERTTEYQAVGRGLRPQSPHSHRVGRKRST